MKPLPISLALLLLLSLGSAQAAPPRKVDARQLLRLAEAGLADSVKAAEATGGRLDRAKPEQRPFWRAVDKMDAALRRVRAGMAARDESFFHALEDGSAALGELRVSWARTGMPDAGVAEGLRILSQSYDLLRSGYGREAVRHRKGSGLTEAERQRFLRIQQAQLRFAELLRQLEESARKRQDEAMLAELRRMAAEAERIAAAQLTLDAYLNALMIGDSQRGEWNANSQYTAPEDRSQWQEAETVVEELYTEEDIGHVFALDLGNTSSGTAAAAPLTLSHFEEATELPDTLAAEAAEIDPLEEEEALYDEEMEEAADADLEEIDAVVEEDEAEALEEEAAVAAEEEIVLEESPDGKKAAVIEEKAKAEETAAPKKEEPAPAPAPDKKDPKKKKSARPPAA